MATCSTHTSAFRDYGIRDGSSLISGTHYSLAVAGYRDPKPTPEYVDKIARAFRQAFIRSAETPLIPEPVDTAIDEATEMIVHRLLDEPDADLRTEILPRYYQLVARTYCAHLKADGELGSVGVWYDDDDDGGIPVET